MERKKQIEGIEQSDTVIDYMLRLFKPPFLLNKATVKGVGVTYRDELKHIELTKETINVYYDLLFQEDLIESHKGTDDVVSLTQFGREVIRQGGWIAYKDRVAKLEKLNQDNIEASILTNKNVRINMWLTLAVAATSVVVSLLQYNISEKDRQDRVKKTEESFSNHHYSTSCKCHDHVSTHATTDTTNVKTFSKH